MSAARKKFSILVTGFEPFGGDARNPSQEIALLLNDTEIAGHSVSGVVLPCVFGAARAVLERAIKERKPGLIVGLGLANGREGLTPERVAINVDDARIADNAGNRPVDRPIVRGGPAAYWSTLPVKAIVAALRSHRIAASVSQTAGTFVCNHAFYGLMHTLRGQTKLRGGFIHVPALPEQAKAGGASMPLEQQLAGIRLAIAVSLRSRRDLLIGDGQIA